MWPVQTTHLVRHVALWHSKICSYCSHSIESHSTVLIPATSRQTSGKNKVPLLLSVANPPFRTTLHQTNAVGKVEVLLETRTRQGGWRDQAMKQGKSVDATEDAAGDAASLWIHCHFVVVSIAILLLMLLTGFLSLFSLLSLGLFLSFLFQLCIGLLPPPVTSTTRSVTLTSTCRCVWLG